MAHHAPFSRRPANIVTAALTLALAGLIGANANAQADDAVSPEMEKAIDLVRTMRWDEAEAACMDILKGDPEDGQAWLLVGLIHLRQDDLIGALPPTLMATVDPKTAGAAMYNMACICAAQKRVERTLIWLQRAHVAGLDVLTLMQQDPDLAAVREEPRFRQLRAHLLMNDAPPFEGTSAPASPEDPELLQPREQCDFLVGIWDYYGSEHGSGVLVTQKLLAGNLIVGNWVARSGARGKTMSFYNPSRNKWFRLWVDAGGGCIVEEGAYTNGTLRFQGQRVWPDGDRRTFRSTLTRVNADRVTQLLESSEDSGKSWDTVGEETWVRRKAGNASPKPPGTGS